MNPSLPFIDIFVLFGLGEQHGAAGYQWIFENLAGKYPLANKEKSDMISGFSLPKATELLGKRTFYSFNFSDQHSLLRTTNARQVITRLGFDVRVATRFIYLLKRTGLLNLFLNKPMQKLIVKLSHYGKMGSDVYGIKAVAQSERKHYECSIVGNNEVNLTAFVATEIAKMTYEQPLQAGVSHINEVVKDIPLFFKSLKQYDNQLNVNL
jgi:saccharopine dehydrogenase (NAD+, L-lysine forming)